MVSQWTFLCIYPVYSLCLCQPLVAVIADEYVVFEYAAHAEHFRLVINPVIYISFRNEDLSG